jgi:hypothetical protein
MLPLASGKSDGSGVATRFALMPFGLAFLSSRKAPNYIVSFPTRENPVTPAFLNSTPDSAPDSAKMINPT